MILFTIIGALVGAGFASGQEIYLFFYRFGINGLLGIILCSFIFGLIIYKSLMIIKDNEINTYNDFLNIIFANKFFVRLSVRVLFTNFPNPSVVFKNTFFANKFFLNKITNIIVNIFLCVTFFIMISGFGAYFFQEYRNK